MPYIWSPEAERALLLAAIQEADLKPSKEVWTNVAATLGGGLTAGAVSQRFGKIKNAAKSGGSLTPAPTTPAKKTPGSKANGSGTGGRKRKKTGSEESAATNGTTGVKTETSSDDEKKVNGKEGAASEEAETPSKKVKTEDREDTGLTEGAGGEEGKNGAQGVNGATGQNGEDGEEGTNGVGQTVDEV